MIAAGSRVRVDSWTVSSRAAGLGEIARARAIAARPFGSREETSPWRGPGRTITGDFFRMLQIASLPGHLAKQCERAYISLARPILTTEADRTTTTTLASLERAPSSAPERHGAG